LNWFLCIISKKPFLEWEIERFIQVHPASKSTIIKQSFYFAYDCPEDLLYLKSPSPEDHSLRYVMGRGYLKKSTGYGMADGNDWDRLLNQQYQPKDIDGHFVAVKINNDYVQVTNDVFDHYPIYYSIAEDYFIVSNIQYAIAAILSKKEMNFAGLSNLALIDTPLERKGLYTNINVLSAGSTITCQRQKVTLNNRAVNFINEAEQDPTKYLFSFKKAFELQIDDQSDYFCIPFDCNFASRFAFATWYTKARHKWGIYYVKNSKYTPEDLLDPDILANVNISCVPDLTEKPKKVIFQPNTDYLKHEIWNMYRSYVLSTGLSNFPELFALAGAFKKEEGISEINMISEPSEWLFEKAPIEKTMRIFKTLTTKKFSNYKKMAISDNLFFHKDFYIPMLVGAEASFKEVAEKTMLTGTAYDYYHFFIKHCLVSGYSASLGWINSYRHFYSPGLLYSLTCGHVQQCLNDKKFPLKTSQLHLEICEDSKDYPKPLERKNIYPKTYNRNSQYFPFITSHIASMIERAENVPLYNMPKVRKLFQKAMSGNAEAITSILKWTAFELWREYIE